MDRDNSEAEMVTKNKVVTPLLAKQWLEKNGNNRPINKTRVEQMRSVIKDGNWMVTHQGVAFYEDGTLADGQHRLAAIAAGDVAVPMMVTWGLSRRLIHAIDSGRPRSVRDVFNFMGLTMTQGQVAAARVMWMDYHAVRSTPSWHNCSIDTNKFILFATHVLPAVDFATPTKKCRGLSHASVMAAIASAWFTQERQRLQRFKDLLTSGVGAETSEGAAVKLREFLLTTPTLAGGTEARREIFLRSCTALRAFFEERNLSKLYCRVDSTFPIPDCPGLQGGDNATL
jgi:hypothetical protein